MFKFATCECQTGYTGDDCEQDEDACADAPCPLGRSCTSLTPMDQAIFGRGYNCTTCPTGFEDIDSKCEDINECNNTTTNICEQSCENTEGSYICNCFNGYRKISGVCQDIDECSEGTSGCEQSCVNTAGSFVCSCVYGFALKEDNKTCNQTLDVCQLKNLTCEYACDNSTGTYECICPAGYELKSNNMNCSNIDECQRRICSQECTDTIGSYRCSCYAGYQLNTDSATCSACVPPSYGLNCNQTCSCGHGADRCDSVRGCICLTGWSGANCNLDVDECTENPTICGIDKICKNLLGGYTCNCLSGYKKVSDNCVDIDECKILGLNNCTASTSTCRNNNGSYTCTCKQGYVQSGAYQCQDFDECAANVDGCSQICNNADGGFNCDCEFGYSLDDDRKTCSRVRDICPLYPNLNCSFGCKQNPQNTSIGYCFCPSGYALNAQDQSSCVDVNECLNDTLNLCSDKTTCVNTPGSYNCTCNTGFFLENNGRNCTECDGFSYGVNCQTPCDCGRGSARCDNVKGCVCNTGWVGDKCNADIDECATGTPCTGEHQVCQNMLGSYNCTCENGFLKNGLNCEDINECTSTPCSQKCDNTHGSYVCSCNAGFRVVDNTQCEDIDECSAPINPCDQTCTNTIGSYKCSCLDGFILNTTTRADCYSKTACSNTTFNCSQNCGVRAGSSEYCFCYNGYFLDPNDNVTCSDTDECSQTPCSENCTQNSPEQGYTCSCSSGKKLDVDQRTCIPCTQGTHGNNCNETCTCDPANTQSCDVFSGACTCKSGWNGTNCDMDIDECNDTNICPDNSECQNKNGSYSCVCNSGFALANGVCVGCSSTTFGQNCAQQCSCNLTNTQECNKVNGSCTCNTGWQGENCTDDVQECNTPNICGINSNCTEEAGTYLCFCQRGYEKDSNGTCINTDECVRGTDDCHPNAVCTDSDGSFNCSCNSGFSGDGLNCTDIDECVSDPCENNGTCRNLVNDYSCECADGFTDESCSSNIDECADNPCENDGTCTDLVNDYRCECADGFTDKNCSSGMTIVAIKFDISIDPANSDSEFRREMTVSLTSVYNTTITGFIKVDNLNITIGSVIVNHEIVYNARASVESKRDIAQTIYNIATGKLKVIFNGTETSAISVTLTDTNGDTRIFRPNAALCTVFNFLSPCPQNQRCIDINGTAQCTYIEKDDNFDLIVGLGVGVPLFFLFALIFAIICIYYKRRKQQNSSLVDDDYDRTMHGDFFGSGIPVKIDSWSRRGPYSPQNWGDDSTMSGDTDRRRDGFDNVYPVQDPYKDDRAPKSNFSWDFMYQALDPNTQYQIKRPQTDTKPNPLYRKRDTDA